MIPPPWASAPGLALPWDRDPTAPATGTSPQGRGDAAVPRDGARLAPGADTPKSLSRGSPARRDGGGPRLGALCRAGAGGSVAAGTGTDGQGTDGQGIDAILCPFPTRSPPPPSCPFPASRSGGHPSEGTRWGSRSPPGCGQGGSGGQGTAALERGRNGAEGLGLPAPRHSPLEHAGSGTGRPLRCWPGLPAVRALLSALFLFLLLFFFFFFPTFPLFPPLALRGGAKRDGRAGRLTLALPLRPSPAAPAGRALPSAGRGSGRGVFKGDTPPPPSGDPPRGTLLLGHPPISRLGAPPQHPSGSSAARAQGSLWGTSALRRNC